MARLGWESQIENNNQLCFNEEHCSCLSGDNGELRNCNPRFKSQAWLALARTWSLFCNSLIILTTRSCKKFIGCFRIGWARSYQNLIYASTSNRNTSETKGKHACTSSLIWVGLVVAVTPKCSSAWVWCCRRMLLFASFIHSAIS